MTIDEAIRCLSVHSSTNGSGLCTDEQHYGAKQMAIKALEKQMPQTPIIENGFVKCPKCKMYIRFPIADKYNNCPECGQAIKWAESEEV